MKTVTTEIKIEHEQEVYILLGTAKEPVIAVGKASGMYVNNDYGITYVIMDLHVVWTRNKKYKINSYLCSVNITNKDLGVKAFLSKDEIKNKIRETRNK